MTDVLIFVPGLMGSELWDAKGKVWPGDLGDLRGYSPAKFDRLCSEEIEVRGAVRKAVGVVDVYDQWIKAFERLRSRETGESLFSEDGPKPTLLTAPYDWRRSASKGADALAVIVAKARDLHGPSVRIHLAAHSMGGVVARYFLQHASFKVAKGYQNVVSLLTFGTPHRGAVVALAGAIGQHPAQFLTRDQSLALTNDTRFPGLYSLFPHPGSRPIWDRSGKQRLAAYDCFAPDWVKRLKLNAASLKDAQRVFEVLRKPWAPVRTFLFVGSRLETKTHLVWNGQVAVPATTPDAGDGTVNLQGAICENQQTLFTDKNHLGLIKAKSVRQTLEELFGADGLLEMHAETEVSISVTDLFIENGSEVELALSVTGPGRELEGDLYVERARNEAGAVEIDDTAFDGAQVETRSHVNYVGPDLTALCVRLTDVSGPGVFRPVFETEEPNPRRFIGPVFIVK